MTQIEQWIDSDGVSLRITNHEKKTLDVELTREAFDLLVTKWREATIENIPSAETHYSKVMLDAGDD